MTDWKELIGKRVLLQNRLTRRIEEAEILELSPNGKCIRVKWMPKGREEWYDIEHFEFNYKLMDVFD